MCRAGRDRFRFDNKGGDGTWICGVCGSGDGFNLLQGVCGMSAADALAFVERQVSNGAERYNAPQELTDEKRREALNALWKHSVPIVEGDEAHRYLAARHIVPDPMPRSLRFCARCEVTGVPRVESLPAMVALLSDPAGKPSTIHRTYIRDGEKCMIPAPKRMMPGKIAPGSAVRLSDGESELLGIAEGIETALAAMAMWRIPVWAATSSTLLAKWEPPAWARRIVIMSDNDAKFGGQAAAYNLAHRLACEPFSLDVQVWMPHGLDTDFADDWLEANNGGSDEAATETV